MELGIEFEMQYDEEDKVSEVVVTTVSRVSFVSLR